MFFNYTRKYHKILCCHWFQTLGGQEQEERGKTPPSLRALALEAGPMLPRRGRLRVHGRPSTSMELILSAMKKDASSELPSQERLHFFFFFCWRRANCGLQYTPALNPLHFLFYALFIYLAMSDVEQNFTKWAWSFLKLVLFFPSCCAFIKGHEWRITVRWCRCVLFSGRRTCGWELRTRYIKRFSAGWRREEKKNYEKNF